MKRFLKNLFGPKSKTIRRQQAARVRLGLDALENRTLMAATLTASFDYADGVLRIEGTDQADQIQINNNADQISITGLSIRSTNSGPVWTNVASIAVTDIGYIEVRALAGNDLVEVVAQNNTPELAPRMVVHGQAGHDTLNGGSAADGLYGGTGNDVINGNGGSDYIEGGYSSDIVSAQVAQLDRDLGFYYITDNNYTFENWGGRGEKYIWGSSPDEGYFILPNGELYRLDYTYQPDGADVPALVDEAKAFYGWVNPERNYAASGTLIATLDPSYHQNMVKLVNASVLVGAPLSQDAFGPQAAQLDRDLALAVEGGESYFGQAEKWLKDGRLSWAELEDRPEFFFYVMPNGELYRLNDWDELGGVLLATLDPSYYQDTTKLADAKELFGDPTDNDTINGGAGSDTLIGGDGSDVLDGGAQHDRLVGGNDNDILNGRAGNDQLYGGHVEVGMAETGNAADSLVGSNGIDSLYGGDGNDTLDGGFLDDLIVGQNGNDLIFGRSGNDLLIGAFEGWAGEIGGNDTIFGEDGSDRIYGGDGDDQLSGGNDNDDMYGERGRDVLWGAFWDSRFETGNAGDTLSGGDHEDRLFGGIGNDRLSGGNDADDLQGDEGNDILLGAHWDSEVETGLAGNDSLTGGHGSDFLFGGQWNDDLDGGLRGFDPEVGEMNDVIDGGEGNDILWGGEGNDTLTGSHGADTLNGENGRDDLDGGLRGFTPETGATNDALDGGRGSDILWGGEGEDTLVGGRGSDTLNGEWGNDHLDGGLLGFISEGNLDNSDLLDGGFGDDSLWGGEGSDTLNGGEGRDTLYGERGGDFLFGDNGNDALYGGGGQDRLEGGFGQDGLFGGTQDARDDLIGGPDPDRFLSADDNDIDRAPGSEDALIHFMGDGTFNFNDFEIELIDKGLAWLHAKRGNPALLKLADDQMTEDEQIITFVRVGAFESPNTGARNERNGRILISTFGIYGGNSPGDVTAVHEIGHNWDGTDDFGADQEDSIEGFIENEWYPLSGWEEDDLFASGKEESLDGDWRYWGWAVFQRPRDTLPGGLGAEYGKTNPMEDWSTFWEAYYVREVHNGSTPGSTDRRGGYDYTPGAAAKFSVLDRFFAGNF